MPSRARSGTGQTRLSNENLRKINVNLCTSTKLGEAGPWTLKEIRRALQLAMLDPPVPLVPWTVLGAT